MRQILPHISLKTRILGRYIACLDCPAPDAALQVPIESQPNQNFTLVKPLDACAIRAAGSSSSGDLVQGMSVHILSLNVGSLLGRQSTPSQAFASKEASIAALHCPLD